MIQAGQKASLKMNFSSENSISAFHYCQNVGRAEYGNIFDWRSSKYEVEGYISEDDDKQSICKNKSNVYEIIGFKSKLKNFKETVDFCINVFSGKIAAFTDNLVVEQIEKEAKDLGISMYFNGFIRNPLNSSTFVEYHSRSIMPSYSWIPGQPNNYGSNYGNSQDCATQMVDNGLNDRECTTALNPVCQVKLSTDFQLTGLGTNEVLDIYYTLGEVKSQNISTPEFKEFNFLE